MRKEKSISLNLEQRKVDRERRTQEQLARENARRSAHGEAPTCCGVMPIPPYVGDVSFYTGWSNIAT
jgi:hypothetical protein